jgi:hypothetical protein
MPPTNGQPAYTVTFLHPIGERLVKWGRLADGIGFGRSIAKPSGRWRIA